ncbi:MAG: hypothetical protein ACLR07_04930 [Christensenellales bacterium]
MLLYAGVGLLLLFCAGAMGFALYRRRRHSLMRKKQGQSADCPFLVERKAP